MSYQVYLFVAGASVVLLLFMIWTQISGRLLYRLHRWFIVQNLRFFSQKYSRDTVAMQVASFAARLGCPDESIKLKELLWSLKKETDEGSQKVSTGWELEEILDEILFDLVARSRKLTPKNRISLVDKWADSLYPIDSSG